MDQTASTKFTLAKFANIIQYKPITSNHILLFNNICKGCKPELTIRKKHRNMYNFIKIDRQGLQLPFKSTQELNYIGYNINRIVPTNKGIFFNTKKQFVLCVFFFKYVKRELITYYMKFNVI